MSDVTTNWILKLTDRISGPMKQVMSSAGNASKAATSASEQTTSSLKKLTSWTSAFGQKMKASFMEVRERNRFLNNSVDELREKLEAVNKVRFGTVLKSEFNQASKEASRLEQQIDKLSNKGNKSAGGGSGSMLKSIVGGNLLSGLITRGAGAVVGGLGASVSAGMEAGKNKTGFQTMAGQKEGSQLFGDLTKYAQDSIYGNEVYGEATTLKSFNIDTKSIMPDLKMIGDISMGDSEKMKSLTLAFAQISSNGKLMGQDLMQLVNAGFNPLQVMSEKTGKSMSELRDMMSKGAISADDVQKAFQAATSKGGQFYQMTDKIANTPFGKWQAFQGQIEGVAMSLGTALMPVVSSVLDVLGQVANALPGVITAFQPLFDKLAQLPIGDLVSGIMSLAQPLISVLVPILGQVIDLGMQIGAALFPVFENLAPVIGTVIDVCSMLLGTIMGIVSNVVKNFTPAWASLSKLFATILVPAIRLVGNVLNVVLKIIGWLLDKITKLYTAIAGGLASAISSVAGFFGLGGGKQTKPKAAPKPKNTPKPVAPVVPMPTITGSDFKFDGGGTGAGSSKGSKGTHHSGRTGSRSAGGNGLAISGSAGGGKVINMTLNIKNYFEPKSGMDVRSIADQIAGQINDHLRDAALSL